jgi:SAM-dependent methyltransferase
MRRADRLEKHRDNADRTPTLTLPRQRGSAWERALKLKGANMSEGDVANAAQQEYWNKIAGPRWVGLAGFVERRVQVVNDLLLARSAVAPGDRVLEIGCGTGAATVPLAQAVGEHGQIVGVDISEPMLAGARKRIEESGLDNVTLLLADAQVHRFEPGSFDLITSRFGVMFFADPTAAFRNLLPALRPCGRLCFACWAALEDNRHWLIPYEVALRHLGPPAPKAPRAPGPMAFSDPDYVRSFLGAAGFDAIEIHRETPAITTASPEEEAEHACIMGPSGRLIDEKQPDASVRERIKQEMTEAFAAYAKSGEMLLPSTVLLVTAQHPQ